MKDNQIDDLFREKLVPEKITPPSGLWDKVEGNLDAKKKGVYFWLSIAAGIIIIFTIGKLVLDNRFDNAVATEALQANATIEVPKTNNKENGKIPTNVTLAKTETDPIGQKEKAAAPKLITPSSSNLTNSLLAHNKAPTQTNPKSSVIPMVSERTVLSASIIEININNNISLDYAVRLNQPKVMPISLANISNAIIGIEELESPKKKRFSMVDGIISLAKGVNSAKETLSEIRTVKNDFVSKELKYGSNIETKSEEKLPNSKDEN